MILSNEIRAPICNKAMKSKQPSWVAVKTCKGLGMVYVIGCLVQENKAHYITARFQLIFKPVLQYGFDLLSSLLIGRG